MFLTMMATAATEEMAAMAAVVDIGRIYSVVEPGPAMVVTEVMAAMAAMVAFLVTVAMEETVEHAVITSE